MLFSVRANSPFIENGFDSRFEESRGFSCQKSESSRPCFFAFESLRRYAIKRNPAASSFRNLALKNAFGRVLGGLDSGKLSHGFHGAIVPNFECEDLSGLFKPLRSCPKRCIAAHGMEAKIAAVAFDAAEYQEQRFLADSRRRLYLGVVSYQPERYTEMKTFNRPDLEENSWTASIWLRAILHLRHDPIPFGLIGKAAVPCRLEDRGILVGARCLGSGENSLRPRVSAGCAANELESFVPESVDGRRGERICKFAVA